ncbi:hypothetical protein MLC59_16535 [Marinobacter bryozoorum]|jgi:hypothetical protein|uniref:hypothetical protein n=1 Tax=Marinobacter bryozoorum TaxID=256324 RepID=UPI002006608D|nr:hypothetical protein [Marinobacter bryozoorum]MCK7545767.1 hypothetical protein [Marinobacter bryozoorum]
MQDRARVNPVPSTVLHNAVELRRAYTRMAARNTAKAVARGIRHAQQWIVLHIRPNRPAAG